MASFTDIIPQFNPYIQQLPVEAMVKVGMQKQAMYDAGVQKIQSQIDNIAGLDVYKPQHKQYLQSKLNELGGNLKMVAAGDFSNYQLVNSVSGMTNQIIKDPIVQNAVYSTQKIRQEDSRMEEARKNGKSSVENEWWFNNQKSSWLADGDLSKKFNGEYLEYVDLDKKLRDVASKIKETDKSVDIPFQRDEQGNVLYYKTDRTSGKVTVSTDPNSGGEKKVDDAMLRVKVKGTSAQKIMDNFEMSLDENDKRQLQITSAYHYRGATRNTFVADATSTINTQKKILSDQIVDWSVQLKTDHNLTSDQKAQLEAAIRAGNDKLKSGDFERKLADKVAEIDKSGDIENYKYKLYTQKYLTGLADAISNESRVEEILSNPYAQMDMQKKQLEFQRERARVQDSQFWANYGLNAARLKIEQDKWDRERFGAEPITEEGGLSTKVAPPTLGTLDGAIKQTESGISALNAKYGNKLFADLSPIEKQKALDKLVQQYTINPNSITDNNERAYVEQMRVLSNTLTRQNNLFITTSSLTKDIDDKIQTTLKGVGGVVDTNGREIYSGRELYDAFNTFNRFRDASGAGTLGKYTTGGLSAGGAGGKLYMKIDEEGYINSLPERLKNLGRTIIKMDRGEGLTSTERSIVNRMHTIHNQFNPQISEYSAEAFKRQSGYLAQHMPEVQSRYGSLNMRDKTTNTHVENLINNSIKAYNDYGHLDTENPSDFNPSTITSWRSGKDKETLAYVAEKQYDGSGRLIIYNGNAKQIIPLTATQLATYFPNVAKTSMMTDARYQIQSSPDGTTNSLGIGNVAGAYYSGYDIGGLKQSSYAPRVRVDVEGASENIGDASDRYQVRMYAYDGSSWRSVILNQHGFVNAAGVEDIMNGIGPTTVRDVLNRK